MRRVLWIMLPLGALACAALPPPPLAADSAIVGVRVAVTDALGLMEEDAEQVYFVRMDDSGRFSEDQVIPSNYASDGYVFLMNAEPGTYAAVAAARKVTSDSGPAVPAKPGFSMGVGLTLSVDILTYLPEAAISHCIVRVSPGTTAFMGEFVLDRSDDFEQADGLQLHYYRLMQPGQEGRAVLAQIFSGAKGCCGTLKEEDRSASALSRFSKRAGARLGKSGWSRALAHSVQPSVP